jgi:hypothetical protein
MSVTCWKEVLINLTFFYCIWFSRGGQRLVGVGLIGGWPEASVAFLGQNILRISIFYVVPMGRWGGSGLRGGWPEERDASLG